MPFGLTNAPATFQRTMDVVLSGLKWVICLVYLDDLIVFSKTFDEQITRLVKVLERISSAGFTLNPKKCRFCLNVIHYLGHVIDSTGQYPDPEKIETVKNFPTPRNLTDVRSFVALGSYYRKFVPKYSLLAEPLTRLTKLNVGFKWGTEQEIAFTTIKQKLMSAPVLIHFDPSLPIEVRTDACGYGLGACLLQMKEEFHPVCYASRLLNRAELNYSTTEKECLALVFAIEKFRHYLEGQKFVVVTDHCALCWLKTKTRVKDRLPSRLVRWSLIIAPFDMTIKYKSGKLHKDVDCLSRYPLAIVEESDDKERKMFALHISTELDISEKQKSDSDVLNIIRLLENEPYRSQFILDNDILYKKSDDKYLVYVPKTLQSDLCFVYHDHPLSGHVGIEATLSKLKEKYYWPRMRDFVTNHVKSCIECGQKKIPRVKPAGKLQSIDIPGPFEMIGIDIVGILPTAQKYRNIIVCTDYFTK